MFGRWIFVTISHIVTMCMVCIITHQIKICAVVSINFWYVNIYNTYTCKYSKWLCKYCNVYIAALHTHSKHCYSSSHDFWNPFSIICRLLLKWSYISIGHMTQLTKQYLSINLLVLLHQTLLQVGNILTLNTKTKTFSKKLLPICLLRHLKVVIGLYMMQ